MIQFFVCIMGIPLWIHKKMQMVFGIQIRLERGIFLKWGTVLVTNIKIVVYIIIMVKEERVILYLFRIEQVEKLD